MLFVPLPLLSQSVPAALPATAKVVEAEKPPPPSDADIPAGIRDVMRNSQLKYQEGSKLLKAGESSRARAAFDEAVDLLFHSDYDLGSTPVLGQFFQDLIRRIQQDESRYLHPETADDKVEGAVVDELDKLDLIPIKVDPSLEDIVAADIARTRYDIPVVLNDKVLKAIDFWLHRGRKFFTDGLMRSGRYRSMIERTFSEESIPLDVMYLAQVESLFKTNAVSRARARGIWQFGRGTALRYGLKVNSYIDERSDPEKSTQAAAHYLSDLYRMFGDWNLVLAAYNWGEGKVLQLMGRSGLNDFWQISELRRRNFPKETKNHVPLIMASIILAHNPEMYGLPQDFDQPEPYESIPVVRPIDLRAAAKILNISLEHLKALNPSLRGMSTPANYADFRLKVPPGAQPEVYEKIAQLPAVKFKPPAEYAGRYKIRQGDTLGGIAARYRITVTQLERANPRASATALKVGSWLQIPAGGTRSTRLGSAKTPSKPPGSRVKAPSSGNRASASKPPARKPATKQIASRE